MRHNGKTIIYTDLDGTFLDENNHSFLESLPALRAVKERDIPVVFFSSKSRAEVEHIRKATQVNDPFIVESGHAILVPQGYFSFSIESSTSRDGYVIVEIGEPYSKLVKIFRKLSKDFPELRVVGFSDLTVKELALECGLTLTEAQRAKEREYTEPFRFSNTSPDRAQAFLQRIKQTGLQFSIEGRYHHLQSNIDKGMSVRFLNEMFSRADGPITTIGIGDSPSDAPMLSSVLMPIIIKRPSGIHDSKLRAQFSRARLSERIGPQGWADEVMRLLKEKA
jgi:mannosyl-3-phosphoglycerate phosphatase